MRPPGYINCPADLMASCLLEKEYTIFTYEVIIHVVRLRKDFLDFNKIICRVFNKKNLRLVSTGLLFQ